MERRKFLIGIGSATVGGSALLGSGAFTRVESQRRVKIEVAEDPDAYLGLDKCEGSPNGSYTHLDEDGHLAVEMSPDNPTIGETPLGEGINSDSFSWFDDVFQICNQGKQAVCIWIDAEPNPELPDPPEEYSDEPRIRFYCLEEDNGVTRTSLLGEENSLFLPVGACKCVGIRTMTKGLSAGDQLVENDEVVIHADADADCDPTELPEFENLGLTSMGELRDDTGAVTGHAWRLRNPNPFPVNFTWDFSGSGETGGDTAPADTPSSAWYEGFFYKTDTSHPATHRVSVDGDTQTKATQSSDADPFIQDLLENDNYVLNDDAPT
ncbi:MAG: DUF1102 domain-containing protein [Halobacteriales archaeon]|nr:DUF1102 domain-containing protein [Halobacteriales archaeon]